MVATLKAILDTRTVSRAAEALGVTQPSVSQSLKRLRDYFGDDLFVRSGNVLHPTPRAVELEPLVEQLMRDVELISQVPRAFDPAAANRLFVVCLSEMAEYIVLPPLAAAFAQQAPGCHIRVQRAAPPQLFEALKKGEIDLAAGTLVGADPSLRQQRLGEFTMTCMVAAEGRWGRQPLTREDYLECSHVAIHRLTDSVDWVTEGLRRNGIHRRIAVTASSDLISGRAVVEADLVSTVALPVGRQLAQLFPVRLVPVPVELNGLGTRLLWHERFQKDASHVWLRKLVESVYRREISGHLTRPL